MTQQKKTVLGISVYGLVSVATMLLFQFTFYLGTALLIDKNNLHNIMSDLDRQIPLIPEWVLVYFGLYLTWAIGALVIVSQKKEHAYRMAAGYCLTMLIAGICFVAYPTTLDRPELVGEGFIMDTMRLLYRIDHVPAMNLCPSVHVAASYFCWRGTFGCKKIPAWFKWLFFILLILCCFSILFVRQHVIIDIPAAVIVCELSLYIAGRFKLENIFLKAESLINHGSQKA